MKALRVGARSARRLAGARGRPDHQGRRRRAAHRTLRRPAARRCGRLRDRGRARERAGGVAVGGKKMPLELALLDDESDATKTVSRLETLAPGRRRYLGGFGSTCTRPPRRSPREQDPVPRRRLRASQAPPAGLPLSFLALLESARHPPGHRGSPRLDPRRRASEDRGDLPGEDRLGARDGDGVDRGRQGRRLRGGRQRRVRASGRQGLLRSHPEAKSANADVVFGLPTRPTA